MYLAIKKGNTMYFGQYFTSENMHHKLLSLINPAVYLLNKMCVGRVKVPTGPEVCQKYDFFPEKEDCNHHAMTALFRVQWFSGVNPCINKAIHVLLMR